MSRDWRCNLPLLYTHDMRADESIGCSTVVDDVCSEALHVLLGERAKGLSPNVIVRLKEEWLTEYEQWSRRDLAGKQYVYLWADGIHVNVRLEDTENKRQCLLVIMAATADGHKELLAVLDGYRESEQSWYELLMDLKQRGLTLAPKLATGDGALGFWVGVAEGLPRNA